MADSPILPGVQGWKDGSGKPLPPEFFRFLRDLVRYIQQIDGNTVELAAILARLDALEAAQAIGVTGQFSISAVLQDANYILRLVGDVPLPEVDSYYGTDSTGNRGWFKRLLSTLADVDQTTPFANGEAPVFDGTVFQPTAVLANPMTTLGDVITADTGGVPQRLPVGADGDVLTVVAGEPAWAPPSSASARGVLITGGSIGGTALVPGDTIGAILPSNYTLTGNWSLWCDPSGSVEIDVRRTAFGSLPPGPGDTICGGNEPAVSSGDSATGPFIGWTTSLSQGDAMTAVVLSATTVTWFTLMLEAT